MSKREIISCFPEVLPKYLMYMLRFIVLKKIEEICFPGL